MSFSWNRETKMNVVPTYAYGKMHIDIIDKIIQVTPYFEASILHDDKIPTLNPYKIETHLTFGKKNQK